MKTTDIKTVIAASAARIAARPRTLPIFGVTAAGLVLRFAAVIDGPAGRSCRADAGDVPVMLPTLNAGTDYAICLGADGGLVATDWDHLAGDVVGGFHFAPGGNATGRAGGDSAPTINPFSCWDLGWRPTCPDPRGMACVDGRFWADIYLTGVNALKDGSSVYGADIADGRSLPVRADGKVSPRFDYEVATAVMAALGKTLLSIEDFFAAAFGVTEATSVGSDPVRTGLDAPRTSKWGLMQATGNMTIWGHDGDPDGPRRAALLGGDWDGGDWSGSRFAGVSHWPVSSDGWIGARGRSDHLALV